MLVGYGVTYAPQSVFIMGCLLGTVSLMLRSPFVDPDVLSYVTVRGLGWRPSITVRVWQTTSTRRAGGKAYHLCKSGPSIAENRLKRIERIERIERVGLVILQGRVR